jgi:hypothetical protein
MTVLKIVIPVFVLLLLGAFCYLTLMNVPVPQKQITKVIPNERFFGPAK